MSREVPLEEVKRLADLVDAKVTDSTMFLLVGPRLFFRQGAVWLEAA